ncbi:MAG: DUF898 family protein [Pseudomonadota bacterium]
MNGIFSPQLEVGFATGRMRLFWLMIKWTVFTVMTLGIYRFWMRTRQRRLYWSAIRIGDAPLEYTGTGLEKLLGFLIAVVFLAVYLGAFQLALMFGVFVNPVLEMLQPLLTVLLILPLIFFARYRARRYILSRTRWRGIRFNAEPAAITYMWHALWHSFVTVLTLGLLYPRMLFKLDQFATERTTYGSLPMRLDGTWTQLFPAWLGLWMTGVVMAMAAVLSSVVLIDIEEAGGDVDSFLGTGAGAAFLVGSLIVLFLYLRWQVVSFRILTSMKRVGAKVRLESSARTARYFAIILLGGLASYVAIIVLSVSFAMLVSQIGSFAGPEAGALAETAARWSDALSRNTLPDDMSGLGLLFVALIPVLLFVGVAVGVFYALIEVFVNLPLFGHFARTIVLHDTAELDEVIQSAQDASREAGGFADALDVGAAI